MSSVETTTNKHLGNPPGGQRRALRQRIGPLVYIGLGSSNGGFPINVSEDGLAFQGVQQLQRDELLSIKFKLPDLENSVETSGQVIWVNQMGTGGGLRFVDLPEYSRILIKNWINSENPATAIEDSHAASPAKTTVNLPLPVTPQETGPASIGSTSLGERESAPGAAHDVVAEVGQNYSAIPNVRTVADINTVSTLHPVHSEDFTRASGSPDFRLETGGTRRWFKSATLWMTTGIAIIAVAAMVSQELGRGSLLQSMTTGVRHLFSGSASVTPLLSPPATETGEVVGDQAVSDHAISESSLEPAHPATVSAPLASAPDSEKHATPSHAEAIGGRANAAISKKTAKQLSLFAKGLTPRTIVRPEVKDVVPPTLTIPVRALPAPLFAIELPEPPASATIRPIQESGNFEAARLLSHKDPVYPEAARAEHYSGSVEVIFTIGLDGSVRNVRAINGNNMLKKAAVEAVKSWHFQPARRDGIPVEVESDAVVNFKLKK